VINFICGLCLGRIRTEFGGKVNLLVNFQMEYGIGDYIDEASSFLECDAVSVGEKFIPKTLSQLGRV